MGGGWRYRGEAVRIIHLGHTILEMVGMADSSPLCREFCKKTWTLASFKQGNLHKGLGRVSGCGDQGTDPT